MPKRFKKGTYRCLMPKGKGKPKELSEPVSVCLERRCSNLTEGGKPVFGAQRRADKIASRRGLSEPGVYSTVVPKGVDKKLRAALGTHTEPGMRKGPCKPVQYTPEQEIILEKQRLMRKEHQQQERGTGRKKGSQKKRTDRGRHGGRKRRRARH